MPRIYTPFMRAQMGEINALTATINLVQGRSIQPVLVLDQVPARGAVTKLVAAYAQQPGLFVGRRNQGLGGAASQFVASLRGGGVAAWPLFSVVEITGAHAAANAAVINGGMFGIRLTLADYTNQQVFPQLVAAWQRHRAADVRPYLFLDAGTGNDPAVMALVWQNLIGAAARLPNAKVVLLGSGAPNLARLPAASVTSFPRHEWNGWQLTVAGGALPDVGFGDWGMLEDAFSGAIAKKYPAAAKARHTLTTSWSVHKGRLAQANAAGITYPQLAPGLVGLPGFNPAHCSTCKRLDDMANGVVPGPGNATQHIEWDWVHHITLTATQVAATP